MRGRYDDDHPTITKWFLRVNGLKSCLATAIKGYFQEFNAFFDCPNLVQFSLLGSTSKGTILCADEEVGALLIEAEVSTPTRSDRGCLLARVRVFPFLFSLRAAFHAHSVT